MLLLGCSMLNSNTPARSQLPTDLANYRQAADYSEANEGLAMLVAQQGKVIFESYAPGIPANQPHPLASGTKSFSCAIAVAAIQDGLLSFDEPVSQTITEWRSDAVRSKITLRQLLSLTSGLSGGTLGRVPTYTEALQQPLTAEPGTRFQYGPVPFQIFGELIRRKLAKAGMSEDPLAYLQRQVLTPIGLQIGDWKRSADGMPNLPSGASLTAHEWAKFGILIANRGQWKGQSLLKPELLSNCFQGSRINPAYGLTFWLNVEGEMPRNRPFHRIKPAPRNLVMAIGAGNQSLYIFPSEQLVIVRQGKLKLRTLLQRGTFEHQRFLSLALGR